MAFPRFLFTRRWVGLLVIALVVAATCIRLGIWQLDRLSQRRAFNAQVERGLAAEAVPLDTLTGQADDVYRRVVATGTYDLDHEVLWYGRALDGSPGSEVLTPLVGAGGGSAVLIDRGWVPATLDTPPVAEAAPPGGEVTVTGFLVPAEGADVIDRNASGRILTIRHADPAALQGAVPYELFPLALQLQAQTPAQQTDLPAVVPPPELTEGPHRSYAVQWFTFATIALVGYVVLVRREVRERAQAERASETEAG
jgi:surfeit locus 1 family protein